MTSQTPSPAPAAAAPFALTGLDHVVFRVVDRERMLAFWCGVLGCPVEREQPELGLVQIRAGTALIDLVTVDGVLGRRGGPAPGRDGHNVEHVCVGVRPFDEAALTAHLARHGVAVVESGPRYGAEGEGPSLYVRDPEGNVIELKGPPA
jgi:catechol 2,3-dioxygenase-like lactoylglutathione lyase family enzyme